jgi:CheY-like chemotaxis protein
MPRFTGIDFLRWLRLQAPENVRETAVMVISASSATAEIECARSLGAKDCFVKPLRWPDLWQAVYAEGMLHGVAA